MNVRWFSASRQCRFLLWAIAPVAFMLVSGSASWASQVRMPAEFEEMGEVIINWDPILGPPSQGGDPDLDPDALAEGFNVLLCQLVKALVDDVGIDVKISVFGPFEDYVVGAILAGGLPLPGCTPSVNFGRVEILQTLPVSIWTRDHGPIGVIKGKGPHARVAYVDTPYYLARPHDDMGPMWLGMEDGQPPLDQITKVKFEGGNLLTDGRDSAWATNVMLLNTAEYLGVDRNDHREMARMEIELRKELRKKLGIKWLEILPSGLVGTNTWTDTGDDALGPTFHVDMGLKIASPDTVLVSQFTDGSTSSQRANAVLDEWAQHFSQRGFDVFRVVAPPNVLNFEPLGTADGLSVVHSYTNSLILNGFVILPSYAEAGFATYDDAAEAVYNAALPNHTVLKIDASLLAPLSGSIHCITREIPAGEKLQGPLPNFAPRSSRFAVIGEATSEGQGVHLTADTGAQSPNPDPEAAYSAVIAAQLGMDVSFGDGDVGTDDFVLKNRSGHNWYFPGIYNVLSYDHELSLSDFPSGTSPFYPTDDDTLRNRYLFPGEAPKNRLEQALALQPETLILDIGDGEPLAYMSGDPAALPPEGVGYFFDQVLMALGAVPSPPEHVAVFTMSNDIGWIVRSLDRLGAVPPTTSFVFTAGAQPFLQAQYDAHNAALRAAVASHGAAVVELDGLLQGLFSDTGLEIGGRSFDLDSAIEDLLYLEIREDAVIGGITTPMGSWVGFTPLMHKVIAYHAIESINAHYGLDIPLPPL